ncbi:MAG: glycoside hydrolase [gamma proteobacterium symbiont of Bathyaustriella thionipta]|nr:glycoside hydrolase [gamma proteobacterium symbiont of Bathyaustriella thionipta]
MHQPCYREGLHGEYRLPWVYLHAIKDYTDMVAHLEQHPGMRLVVNFAPVLLEQLLDYSEQIAQFLKHGTTMKEPLLNLLAGATAIPQDSASRHKIVQDCQRAHGPRMIEPYTPYRKLLHWTSDDSSDISDEQCSGLPLSYLGEQYFLDLLTWYHLSWLGHSLKREPLVKRLMQQACHFSDVDRHQLLGLIGNAISEIIPRYRALAESGQIELSMTPYGHPIVPLLNDFNNMQCSQPDAPRPGSNHYPGGAERNHWHMQKGFELFEKHFGIRPKGVWLSEGAVSADALQLLDEYDIQWTASGEGVWRNSARLSEHDHDNIQSKRSLFQPFQLEGSNTRLFFRDDGLSDLIGFEYSNWAADDAVANFTHHIRSIGKFLGDDVHGKVVSVILDGENAWEYYPDNGHYFLDKLYAELSADEDIELLTFSEAAALTPKPLQQLCPGSWVYGSFSTWIGQADKNRAWDLLVEAKHVYDRAISSGQLSTSQRQDIDRQLGICEGSDWFWWFGDYNPSDSVQDFDILFRQQLHLLYRMLGEMPPASLDVQLSHGGGNAENSGTMRRNA